MHSVFLQILLIWLFFGIPLVNGQEVANIVQREIGISLGMQYSVLDEARYSNQTKRYLHPSTALYFAKQKGNRKSSLELRYSSNGNAEDARSLWYKIVHPQVTSTYQRKVNNTWLGGYFESSTLLLFPQNTRGLFGNNPISYTLTQSLGLALDRRTLLVKKANQTLGLNLGIRTALLSHVVRPLYAHPYPEHYFQEGVFSPTRERLGRSLFRSGKLRTLNKFQSIQLAVGLTYIHNNRWKAGIGYVFQLRRVAEARRLSYRTHDLRLQVSYLY